MSAKHTHCVAESDAKTFETQEQGVLGFEQHNVFGLIVLR